jgi:NADH-quinone oxidoreductase subunit L
MDALKQHPGWLYVVATLLPLASFVFLLLFGAVRNIARAYRRTGLGGTVYGVLGGDTPPRIGPYVATAAIGLSCVLSIVGLVWFLSDFPVSLHEEEHDHDTAAHVAADHKDDHKDDHDSKDDKKDEKKDDHAGHDHSHGAKGQFWAGALYSIAEIGMKKHDPRVGLKLEVGYYIDHLSAIMFVMVTFIATLIHIFSAGYMSEEMQTVVGDHSVHAADGGHYKRAGRYSRFFMYLSLFCFSMLNLILADNLFQIFVSWELVGICSFLLIGFYFERQSASNAANKAFIVNRVGDAGMIVGLLIVWAFLGTFNFQEIFQHVRGPVADSHGEAYPAAYHNTFVRGDGIDIDADGNNFVLRADGDKVLLIPAHNHSDVLGEKMVVEPYLTGGKFSSMPYILLTVAGLGIFLGCVGKSAQFPLQVWLPDAMEGPTPVSALIHAATMVAAGVYLVGRVFPLFTPEARLVIAYTGAITLFVAATIAIVMQDIKKVLAYSTVSQLGYMMLALGIGGWVAGLLHLLTHAFFKALLFLGSGSVIYGCHHEQDMRKMGGLFPKMKITAITMLIGVLAIAGTPLFSGWYSKDAIIAQGLAFVTVHKEHMLLLILPLVTAGITCFYMFRMWFLTFMGKPKDQHVYDHATESPWLMTVPLILLAFLSVVVAWGLPPWNAEASYLGRVLEASQPAAVATDFGAVGRLLHDHSGWVHPVAGLIALGAALIGAVFAYLVYMRGALDPAETKEQFAFLYRLFERKWYFDELYSALLVRPALVVANWCRLADSKGIDGIVNGTAKVTLNVSKWDGLFDKNVIDGLVNVLARTIHGLGTRLRRAQTGQLRNYVVFLALAALAIFAVLSYFISLAAAGH